MLAIQTGGICRRATASTACPPATLPIQPRRGNLGGSIRIAMLLAAAPLLAPAAVAAQVPSGDDIGAAPIQLDATGLFRVAERAEAAQDWAVAEVAYRALAEDPDPELHTEARFRLALLLADRLGNPAQAGQVLYRILAEKPGAARVRLELARVEAQMGRRAAAARALRGLQGAQLPPEVERMVRFFSGTLAAARAFGGSIEVAALADGNANRATRSDTLGTVIGDFTLDRDARARPGLGMTMQAQGQARAGIAPQADLLVRISGSADIYQEHRFDNIALALQAGPDFASGRDRIRLSAGPVWRWYGGRPYSMAWGGAAEWQHPVGQRSRLRIDGAINATDNRRNALQNGTVLSAGLSLDRVVSQRLGGGVQVQASRTTARDPGYADVTAGGTLYVFRSMGAATLVLSGSYSRLEADARLFLYPRRRRDDRFSAMASATMDRAPIAGFAPFARVRAERNRSTVEIYAYSRLAVEAGLSRSF